MKQALGIGQGSMVVCNIRSWNVEDGRESNGHARDSKSVWNDPRATVLVQHAFDSENGFVFGGKCVFRRVIFVWILGINGAEYRE